MEELKIEGAKYTPSISMSYETNTISMVGKSYPENTFEFYAPVMNWLEKYKDIESKDKLTINMEIVYFNSSSSKLFFDFFDLAESIQESGRDVEVNWIYDEENGSALEAGEDFQEDFEELNFNLVQK